MFKDVDIINKQRIMKAILIIFLIILLGLMNPSGRLTSNTKEKANTTWDNKFSLKESHSIAETL